MAFSTRPTLKQVAELAKVSQTTASMIMNEKQGIAFSADTIQRVRLAAQRLGYLPAPAKESAPLFQGRMIVIFSAAITGYYYSALAQAIEQAAQKEGYETLCFQTFHSSSRELSGMRLFGRSDVAGMIFTYIPQNYRLLEELKLPCVVIGDHNDQLRVNMVETNNYAAGLMMARHVLGLGHRKAAFLNDRYEWQGFPTSTRLHGVQAVFEREYPGAELVEFTHQAQGEASLKDYHLRRRVGYGLAASCLESRPDVTCMMCVTDMIAYGAMECLRERGMEIPRDMSVCGFDNNFAADLLGLTTHDYHIPQIGVQAFQMLAGQLGKREGVPSITKMELMGEVIPRETTAPPRRRD